uniref:Sulfatase domain-containing protein n=1 Tax=Panagrellus redivivus TaxID=6233 RepID=A0A7E4VI49_PANRE
MIRGPWTKLTDGSVPECDIIETNCRENRDSDPKSLTPDDKDFKDTVYYEFLHAQVYRKDMPEKMPEIVPLDRPDVHIFVIDSVSNSHFVRAMPKTRHYLKEHFGAVHFQYLNKVGINSRRNGMAFLLGKTAISIPKSPLSRGYSHECFNDSLCCNLLDNGQFIGFQFREAAYKTLSSEDYVYSMFSAGECHGFNNTPLDHYMRPYQLRVDLDAYKTKILQENIYKGMCRDSYMPLMDYLQDLLDKFPDKPKFSLTWLTKLAHDDNNELFRADDYFYSFLKKNSKQFENSYLFVMADHGVRFGLTRLTAAGEREDNNPFLMMSLPASLRGDDALQNTIRNNAKQLISHYDLYATFVDIVTPFRPKNSSMPDLHGSSLFKPLPQPRSCDRLRVPFEYCICDHPKSTLPDDAPPGRDAGDAAVTEMNKVINGRRDLKYVCSNLTLSSAPVGVESFKAEGDLAIFKITYKVSPGEGQYSGHLAFEPQTSKFLQASDFEVSSSPRLRSFFEPQTSKFLRASGFEVSSSLGLRCFFEPRTSSPDGLQAPDFEVSSSLGLRVQMAFEPQTSKTDGDGTAGWPTTLPLAGKTPIKETGRNGRQEPRVAGNRVELSRAENPQMCVVEDRVRKSSVRLAAVASLNTMLKHVGCVVVMALAEPTGSNESMRRYLKRKQRIINTVRHDCSIAVLNSVDTTSAGHANAYLTVDVPSSLLLWKQAPARVCASKTGRQEYEIGTRNNNSISRRPSDYSSHCCYTHTCTRWPDYQKSERIPMATVSVHQRRTPQAPDAATRLREGQQASHPDTTARSNAPTQRRAARTNDAITQTDECRRPPHPAALVPSTVQDASTQTQRQQRNPGAPSDGQPSATSQQWYDRFNLVTSGNELEAALVEFSALLPRNSSQPQQGNNHIANRNPATAISLISQLPPSYVNLVLTTEEAVQLHRSDPYVTPFSTNLVASRLAASNTTPGPDHVIYADWKKSMSRQRKKNYSVSIKVTETCYEASEPSSKVNRESKETANCASEQVGQVEYMFGEFVQNLETVVKDCKKHNQSMVAMSQETHQKEGDGRDKKFLASNRKSANSDVNKRNGARIRGSRVQNRTTKKDVKMSKPREDRAATWVAVLMPKSEWKQPVEPDRPTIIQGLPDCRYGNAEYNVEDDIWVSGGMFGMNQEGSSRHRLKHSSVN